MKFWLSLAILNNRVVQGELSLFLGRYFDCTHTYKSTTSCPMWNNYFCRICHLACISDFFFFLAHCFFAYHLSYTGIYPCIFWKYCYWEEAPSEAQPCPEGFGGVGNFPQTVILKGKLLSCGNLLWWQILQLVLVIRSLWSYHTLANVRKKSKFQ